jgi:hypothetical protein
MYLLNDFAHSKRQVDKFFTSVSLLFMGHPAVPSGYVGGLDQIIKYVMYAASWFTPIVGNNNYLVHVQCELSLEPSSAYSCHRDGKDVDSVP